MKIIQAGRRRRGSSAGVLALLALVLAFDRRGLLGEVLLDVLDVEGRRVDVRRRGQRRVTRLTPVCAEGQLVAPLLGGEANWGTPLGLVDLVVITRLLHVIGEAAHGHMVIIDPCRIVS